MWSFNPVVYIQHAWNGTKTKWGKASLILFYTFIWLSILSSIWSLFDPESQGSGCIFADAESNEKESLRLLFRSASLFVIGFLLYADKGGLHSWNVAMVTFFFLSFFWLWSSYAASSSTTAACGAVWSNASMCIMIAWLVGALVTILLEEKLGGENGTEEERQSLNV